MTIQNNRIISISDYSCRYGSDGPLRLNKVSLDVAKGEFLAIIGPSGGGKSTLAFSINGMIPHEIEGSETAGEIDVSNLSVRNHRPHELVQAVGTVLQDPEWQLITFTIGDEIAFGPENLGVPPKEIRKRIDQVAPLLKLKELLEHSPDQLSGGQKQRVAIASCLALESSIMILDEPLAELDPLGKETVLEAVISLNKDYGVTVVFIDHNLDVVIPYADRIVLVAEGQIAAQGTVQEVLKQRELFKEFQLLLPQAMEIASALPEQFQPCTTPISVDSLSTEIRQRFSGRFEAKSEEQDNGIGQPGRVIAEIKGVTFRYPRGQEAISNIDLQIKEGDFIGLIGQNGAGKSTLAKLLTGLLKPTEGTVLIEDQVIAELSRKEIAKQVGYVFQNPDFQFFSSTCFEEISYGLRLKGLPEDDIQERVLSVLEQMELLAYRDEHPHFLSRGQRRRIAIASVLVLEPQIIILDEPTTGLDGGTARRILDVVSSLHSQGHTIIMLTHEMRAVLEYCSRVILVNEGHIVLDDEPSRAFWERDKLESCGIRLPPAAALIEALPWHTPPQMPRTSKETASLISRALRAKANTIK